MIKKNTISKLGLAMALLVVLANTASATPVFNSVPDAGSSASLLGLAIAGLAAVRRFIR